MRILQLRRWLSARDDNGGKMRASGLARALSRFAEVDAVGFAQDADTVLQGAPPLAHYRRLYPVPPDPTAARTVRTAAELARGRSLRVARFCSRAYRRRVRSALAKGDYDVVQVEEIAMLPHVDASAATPPIVYSAHNVESALAEQLPGVLSRWLGALGRLDRRRASREERRALETARLCLAVSEQDRLDLERLGALGGCPIHVVPNCAGDDVAPPDPSLASGERPRRAVFVASFSWYPNADGACWFLAEILPHLHRIGPPCAVHFVGSGIRPALARRIRAAGCASDADVPDTRLHLERARVAMVPLRSGAGTRLKIVEAWASGVPVVSTSWGAAGLGGTDGVDLILADEPATFAESVSRVLTDDGLHHRLRESGLRRAAPMRWARQAPLLEALYATLK